MALPLRELVTHGLPLTELDAEALPVLVPEPREERLSDNDGDTVLHAEANAVPLGVGTSLRESDGGAVVLPELVTVAVLLPPPLDVELAALDWEALALRELLGERHAEGDKEGLAEDEGVPNTRVRVGGAVGAPLEDAELHMLSVGPLEREGDTPAERDTLSVGDAEEVNVGAAEREGVGVVVVALNGEGVAASPEGLRALDAVGELVPEAGAVAESVALCVSVTVTETETPLDALEEGIKDGVVAVVTVALNVLLTVSVAEAVKDAELQLDSDGENETVLVRVEVTLSGSVGRDVEDAEGVPVKEGETVFVTDFPVVPLEEGEPVCEGDEEPVKGPEGVGLEDAVTEKTREKEVVGHDVEVGDCDTVSELLRLKIAERELVKVAPREGDTVTEAVSACTVPVAEVEIVRSVVLVGVPDALAAAEREPDAQPLLLREAAALGDVERAADGDLLWEPLPVLEGVCGADSEKVMSAEAVLLLVEDSDVEAVRVPSGVTVEQPMEALTLADAGREFVADGVEESAPELEELITERVDTEGVDVAEGDAGADFVRLAADVSEAVAESELHGEDEAVVDRESAAEAENERDARALDETVVDPQSDAVGEALVESLGAPDGEREASALADALKVADSNAEAEWLGHAASEAVAFVVAEMLGVGVAEPRGERDPEVLPDSLPLRDEEPEAEL